MAARTNASKPRARSAKRSKSRGKLAALTAKVNALAKASQANKHIISTSAAGTALATAGTVVYLSGISQGDDIINRNGNSINIEQLRLRVHAINGVGATAAYSLRCILFTDSEQLGALPAVTDVLTTATVWSSYAINNRLMSRFKIIRDKVITVGASGSDSDRIDFQWLIKKNMIGKVNYINVGNSIASAGKNSVFFAFMLSSITVGVPAISYDAEISFDA